MTHPTPDPLDPAPSPSSDGPAPASPNAAEALQQSGELGVSGGLPEGLPAQGDRPSESNVHADADADSDGSSGEDEAPIVTGIPDLLRGG